MSYIRGPDSRVKCAGRMVLVVGGYGPGEPGQVPYTTTQGQTQHDIVALVKEVRILRIFSHRLIPIVAC